MYTDYFGLNENPFSIAPDPLYLYMSEHHREALAHLRYGLKCDGGFVLLTGEVGAGKTTLCRSLLEKLPDDIDIAFIFNPKLSVIELLETVCDELRIDYPAQASIKRLVDRLNAHLLDANARGRKTVLIIDEAQNLSVEVLEQLRLLTNLETNRYKLLQIVLLGQPELLQLLGRRELRQLAQRVTARFHLGPLEAEEVAAYVRHRLEIAGCHRPLFPAHLSKRLWQLTGGVPRLINLVCDRALLGAYARELPQVDERILRQAAHEVLGETAQPRRGLRPAYAALAATSVLLLALFALRFWPPSPTVSIPAVAGPVPAPVEQPLSTAAVAPAAGQPEPAEAEALDDEPGLPRTWPVDFAMHHSRQAAFADLVELWGLTAAEGRADGCSFAREAGLECLARKDSLATLRAINRPAILTLYADDGAPFYVVMAALHTDSALFIAAGEQREISLAALSARWFGDSLLLWQPPAFGRTLLEPGGQGAAVTWLATALDELGLYTASGRETVLRGELLGAFKRFQFNRGLTPDGILGPLSMIHLNSVGGLPGPRLLAPGES
ncbi:MAG: AAA family ATPase [Desulfuromonadales bacterium]|nr:AAA family ATPase [Desulfuromonadales bacterium]